MAFDRIAVLGGGAWGTALANVTARAGRSVTLWEYDAGNAEQLPGTAARADGDPPSGDVAVDEAYEWSGETLALFQHAFVRRSIDDRGSPVLAGTTTTRSGMELDWYSVTAIAAYSSASPSPSMCWRMSSRTASLSTAQDLATSTSPAPSMNR